MTTVAPNLRFVGHTGEISQPKNAAARTMFIPDANLVLTLLNNLPRLESLPKAYREYVLTTRVRVRLHWHDRAKFIPVNATIAALELSKQDEEPNYAKYLTYYQELLLRMYQIDNVDPRWIAECYHLVSNIMNNEFRGVQRTVTKALEIMPVAEATNDSITRSVNDFCDWIEGDIESLTSFGGPQLFVPILAFAGSAEARRILKVDQVSRSSLEKVSRNVAWDFMYFSFREIAYVGNQYKNDIFCTGDDALAQLLLMKIHRGPRFSLSHLRAAIDIPTGGNFYPLPCPRIESSPKLALAIEARVQSMWLKIGAYPHVVSMGLVR